MKKYYDFLGSEVSSSGRDCVYVIPVPIEWSTSYGRGTARAPEAILEASRQIELYNHHLDLDLEGSGVVTLRPELRGKDDVVSFIGENREMLSGAFSCFIGGEHSITPWILEGFERKDIGIVWLDAHADLRESYLGERESHACAARNSLPFGPIVEIGVRSYSREERDFLGTSDRIEVFGSWDKDARNAVRGLPRNIYLSLDFDAVDPSLLRAVGTPEPEGPGWDDIIDLFDFLFEEKNVFAMDAVELSPADNDETSNFIAAKIIYEAISRYLGREPRA
jgi:agmatinase